jgi:hypothetical protein
MPDQPDDAQSLEILTMKEQIEELSRKTRSLRKQISSQRVEMYRMRGVINTPTAANATLPTLTASARKKAKDAALKKTVAELLDEYNTQWIPKWGRKRKGKLLAEVFWDVMDGVAAMEKEYGCKYICCI